MADPQLSNPSQVEAQIAKGDASAFIRPGDTGKLEIKQHYAKKLAMIAQNDSVVAKSFDAFNIKFDSNGMMTNPDLFDEAVNIVQQRANQVAGIGQIPVNSVVDQVTSAIINKLANPSRQPAAPSSQSLTELSSPKVDFPSRGTGQFRDGLSNLESKAMTALNQVSTPEKQATVTWLKSELDSIADTYNRGAHNVVDRLPAWMATVENNLGSSHPNQVREIRAVYNQLRTQAPAQVPTQAPAQAPQRQGQEVGQSSGSSNPTTQSLNGRYGNLVGPEQSTQDFVSYREQIIAGERAIGVNRAAKEGLIADTEYRAQSTNNYKAEATETYWRTVAEKQEIVGRAHVDKARAQGKYAAATGHATGLTAVANALTGLVRFGAALDGNKELVRDMRDIQRDNARLARQQNRSRNRGSSHGNNFNTSINVRMK